MILTRLQKLKIGEGLRPNKFFDGKHIFISRKINAFVTIRIQKHVTEIMDE